MNRNNAENTPTVLISGATGGIGSALAHNLVRKGASLYLLGRNQTLLTELESELTQELKASQMIKIFCADLSDKQQIQALAVDLQKLPAVNVLINNAGINHFGLFNDMSVDDMESIFNVNVLAPMLLTHALLPTLKREDRARIINIGSVFGSIGYPGFAAYSASKFALRGFSEALARELSDTNVTVGYFAARATDTKLNNASVVALNKELKTNTDSPEFVAKKVSDFVYSNRANAGIGLAEKFFARVNAIRPALVSNSLNKQLPIIKRFAKT